MILARIHEDKDHGGNYSWRSTTFLADASELWLDSLVNQLKYLGKKIEVGEAILIAL